MLILYITLIRVSENYISVRFQNAQERTKDAKCGFVVNVTKSNLIEVYPKFQLYLELE